MPNSLNIPMNHRSLTRSLAAALAVAGFLTFAPGSAEAACPTFKSAGWSVITHAGRTKIIQRFHGGDWRPSINLLQKKVDRMKARNNPNAERYEKRLSVVRCLAESQTGKQIEQVAKNK